MMKEFQNFFWVISKRSFFIIHDIYMQSNRSAFPVTVLVPLTLPLPHVLLYVDLRAISGLTVFSFIWLSIVCLDLCLNTVIFVLTLNGC